MIVSPSRKPETQVQRLVRYLRVNPGASTMELQLALRPFVSNPRARISDARQSGIDIECIKRDDGQRGFVVRDEPTQTVLGL